MTPLGNSPPSAIQASRETLSPLVSDPMPLTNGQRLLIQFVKMKVFRSLPGLCRELRCLMLNLYILPELFISVVTWLLSILLHSHIFTPSVYATEEWCVCVYVCVCVCARALACTCVNATVTWQPPTLSSIMLAVTEKHSCWVWVVHCISEHFLRNVMSNVYAHQENVRKTMVHSLPFYAPNHLQRSFNENR